MIWPLFVWLTYSTFAVVELWGSGAAQSLHWLGGVLACIGDLMVGKCQSTNAHFLSDPRATQHSDKKKVLLRSGVVPQIVQAVFGIMAEPYDADDDDRDEDEAPVPVHAGFIIQSFAMHLSAQVCATAFCLFVARCRVPFNPLEWASKRD